MSFRLNQHAKLHCFKDGSGLAIYSRYSGDTLSLRAECCNTNAIANFITLSQFTQIDLVNALGISDKEALSVVEYLRENNLIDNLNGT